MVQLEQDDMVSSILGRALTNAAQSLYDDYVKANASFRSGAGLKAKLIRTMHGHGCPWCRKLAGTYDYDDAPADIYRRHDNCSCTVIYECEKGRQDVHSKKWETKKIDTNSNDNMGKKKPRVLEIGNKTYSISTYKNDLYTNIYCQTNSINSRKFAHI